MLDKLCSTVYVSVPPQKRSNLTSVDVVQSVKTGPVEETGRGVAVIGVTSRVVSILFLYRQALTRRILCSYLKNESSRDSPIGCGESSHLFLPTGWAGKRSFFEQSCRGIMIRHQTMRCCILNCLDGRKCGSMRWR